MPNITPNARFEIDQLHCSRQALEKDRGVKYIVTKIVTETSTESYHLFANGERSYHVAIAALDAKVPDRAVIGGGYISTGGQHNRLNGHSKDYGPEPIFVREAFLPLVNAKLREMGMLD